jgi:hypothetical protein
VCDSTNGSLQALAAGVLGVELEKDPAVRCGNWEADTLSQRQVNIPIEDIGGGATRLGGRHTVTTTGKHTCRGFRGGTLDWEVRCGNWEADTLSQRQVNILVEDLGGGH